MKKVFAVLLMLLSACNNKNEGKEMKFAVSAEYPPFEYYSQGKIVGFDIDLAELVAKKLDKEAVFENMQFSTILPSLSTGQVDAAISTFTITEERKKSFDFSNSYYNETLAALFKEDNKITDKSELEGKVVACQLGSAMEIWVKENVPSAKIMSIDNNNQAVEALKSGHAEFVILDGVQGFMFSKKNPGLGFSIIAKSENGYGIALPKNSHLTKEVNQALNELKDSGEIKRLQDKWIGG